MNWYILLVAGLVQQCFAPPVTQTKKEAEEKDSQYNGLEDYMEYHRYLKEVVDALESDANFRQKLEKADENEIKSGRIAEELQFVSHHVRTRLDEIKRVELQRLRELMEKKIKLEKIDSNAIEVDDSHHHLDKDNLHTFEIDDLKKLIAKTTEDLARADKIRKEEFKQYEMEKEYKKQEKLNHTNGAEQEKLEKEFQEMETKHKTHEKLHEPGHKAQLEEVWEEQDQMQQDFDPKTFFMLHDIDGNGLWDQEEVKALFITELNKMYQQGAPEDDMRERIEEMERMRESVFAQMDQNMDGFIDYNEFIRQTKSNEFQQDHGWQGLDEQTRPYTDEELQEYIRRNHGGPQFYPGQVPQMQQQPLDLNTNEIYQGAIPSQYPDGGRPVPQAQYNAGGHPNAIPQGQYQPAGQQIPQQQQYIPQGQYPASGQQQYQPAGQQIPQQQQYIPQGQYPASGQQQQYPAGGHPNPQQQANQPPPANNPNVVVQQH